MLQQAKTVFKNDSLGRIRLIGWLHDFENIDRSIQQYKKEIDLIQNSNEHHPSARLEIDDIVWKAFFPKLQMKFSQNENPMQIVDSLQKTHQIFMKELLLFQQKLPLDSIN